MLELFSSKVSVDQDLSVIVAETINDDDVKQRPRPNCFSRARDTVTWHRLEDTTLVLPCT